VTPKWLELAIGEIGVKETAGRKANPRILEYFRAAKSPVISDETAWCSAFAAWCIAEAGYIPSYSLGARSWLRWGVPVSRPKIGAIAIFPRGKEPWMGHVGFVAEVKGDKVLILGGNQRNSVRADWYTASTALGYRWPPSMGTSRTVKAQTATLASSAIGLVADVASEAQPLAETAAAWADWAQYVAYTCAIVMAVATIYFKYQDTWKLR
jgi:uncharacterized protein (TIGR02594 family)